MQVEDLGIVPFQQALDYQLECLRQVVDGGEERLLLLEHPPVVTFGTGGGAENLHVSEAEIRARGIDLVPIRRGGNVTCHFPGQLVAYPIFRIARRPGGIRAFFHDMEEVVIRALDRYGLPSGRFDGRPGVWRGQRKLCSMGIGVKRWVSYHGLALNVLPDVSLFNLITLCGLTDAVPTSVHAELVETCGAAVLPDMQEMKDVITEEFRAVFAHTKVVAHQAAE